MSILFHSAFYLAKQGRPFTDFKDLVALQVANGLDIPPSDKQACVFMGFIYDIFKDHKYQKIILLFHTIRWKY